MTAWAARRTARWPVSRLAAQGLADGGVRAESLGLAAGVAGELGGAGRVPGGEGPGEVDHPGDHHRVVVATDGGRLPRRLQFVDRVVDAADGQQQPAAYGTRVGQHDRGRIGRGEPVLFGERPCLVDLAAGEQRVDEVAGGGPVQGQAPAHALGQAQPLAQGRLGLPEPASPAVSEPDVGMGQGEVAAGPPGGLVGAQGFGVQGVGPVEPVGEGVRVGQHQQEFDAPFGVGPAEPGCQAAVDERTVAQLGDLLGALAVGQGVEAAQDQQRALGVVLAGAGPGEFGEALGASG